ncbi:MAG: hypothetical protein KAG66_01085 [Methylococcales bacterium]|jgi:hypothetical protein|nr:hypothetical protein [Methylococcales bacterium]|tara:strand:- start:1565 stop:2395 length:831 start_codon:yes stop_codon:yes gene_type:complete
MANGKDPSKILRSISEGEPVSWRTVLNTLERIGMNAGSTRFMLKPADSRAKKTNVQVLDRETFDTLLREYPVKGEADNRIAAAHEGNSHAKPVTGSLLNLNAKHWIQPNVAVSWDDKTWTPAPSGREYLLLVENMQNFLRADETIDFLRTHCGVDIDQAHLLLGYGAGNAAAKKSHGLYYAQFKKIYCLFDIDSGGFKTYDSIKKNPHLGTDTEVVHLCPDDIESRLAKSNFKLSNKERTDLAKIAEKNPELTPILLFMRKAERKLEQETYLRKES